MLLVCAGCGVAPDLDVSFLTESWDPNQVSLVGDVTVDSRGAQFSGEDDDYVSISSFAYATGGSFTVSMWCARMRHSPQILLRIDNRAPGCAG